MKFEIAQEFGVNLGAEISSRANGSSRRRNYEEISTIRSARHGRKILKQDYLLIQQKRA